MDHAKKWSCFLFKECESIQYLLIRTLSQYTFTISMLSLLFAISFKFSPISKKVVINSFCCFLQRWSRVHKDRGQGQGHKKNPRPSPRTAFPRTDTLEAKDRNARGQGQRPRTQPQVFSKKKQRSSKKFFRQSLIYRRSQNF